VLEEALAYFGTMDGILAVLVPDAESQVRHALAFALELANSSAGSCWSSSMHFLNRTIPACSWKIRNPHARGPANWKYRCRLGCALTVSLPGPVFASCFNRFAYAENVSLP
jgi:hypothetical protein